MRNKPAALSCTDAELGFLLGVAVSRALVATELALGGILAERVASRPIDDGPA